MGFCVFLDPKKWQNLLSDLSILTNFFCFFDEERGKHLKIFFRNSTPQVYQETETYLRKLLVKYSSDYENTENDILFKNFEPNTIFQIHHLETNHDIVYDSKILDEFVLNFMFEFSSILMSSLNYNNFFIHEKNRLNFALQLVFLSITQTDLESVIEAFSKEIKKDKIYEKVFLNSKETLVVFFEEITTIEQENGIEHWVKNWLKLSNSFLKKAPFLLLIEILCQVLNIKTQKKQLIYLTKETLKSSRVKV